MAAILRIHGAIDARLEDVRDALGRLEHAYNSIYAFERAFARAERVALRGSAPAFMVDPFAWTGVPIRTARMLASWPPTPATVASMVASRDRLVLHTAQFKPGGFWEVVGAMGALDVIRQYVNDRGERRHDRAALESRLLEHTVVRERIEIARSLGTSEPELAPLLNELVHRPLRALDGAQDEGLLQSADILEIPRPG